MKWPCRLDKITAIGCIVIVVSDPILANGGWIVEEAEVEGLLVGGQVGVEVEVVEVLRHLGNDVVEAARDSSACDWMGLGE